MEDSQQSMFPMRVLSIIALCAVLLASCDQASKVEVPQVRGDGSWPVTVKSDGGGYEVTLQPSGGGILWNKHFSLEMNLKSERPLSEDFEVRVDADMPAHRHGMNTKAEVFDQGKFAYVVEGMLFHMKGDWVITVELTEGGVTEKAEFPVLIK